MAPSTSFDIARAAVADGADPVDEARALVAAMSPDERLWCLDGDAPTWAGLGHLGDDGYHHATFVAGRNERLGIPGIAFADGPRGAVVGQATSFPVPMARGATWDPDLETRVGEAIGRELRAVGANLTGAVCINLLRHPAWGRAQETYGEEPHHVGALGAAFTRGLQQHVMACMKHFACNSMENARFQVDIDVDEVALHEVYLPHFRRVADQGVASVMSAYNSVNGEWCGESPSLLTDVLRTEWGFAGFVISDWIFGLRDAATSLTAGLDIEMPYRMVRQQHLADALDQGEADWADVDAAATRIIATLLRFDAILSADRAGNVADPASAPEADPRGSAEHRALARDVAARSVVLLRDEMVEGTPALPLPASSSLAVIGRLADTVNTGDGWSSDVWDHDCVTVLGGLEATTLQVTADDGSDPARAAAVAADADAALVVVGYTYLDEGEYIGATDPELPAMFPPADEPEVAERFAQRLGELPPVDKPDWMADRARGFGTGGDRTSLRLADDDVALIRAVAAANPRTIVAIQAGSAVIISEWVDEVAAVVQAWYGGSQAGPGLADVLLGAVNPSGRLPFSVVADEADLPAFDRDARSFTYDRWHGWRHLEHQGTPAAFPFGFGLSYTTFEMSNVAVRVDDEKLDVRVSVSNRGDRDGAEVVQVYATLPVDEHPPRLVGFARIELAAGCGGELTITVPLSHLATRDATSKAWLPAHGAHRITVARHVGDPGSHSVEVHL